MLHGSFSQQFGTASHWPSSIGIRGEIFKWIDERGFGLSPDPHRFFIGALALMEGQRQGSLDPGNVCDANRLLTSGSDGDWL